MTKILLIKGTRIGVHDVVGFIVNGSSIDDVVRSFPDLTRAQVYESLAYYEDHRAEIDLYGSSPDVLDVFRTVRFFLDHDVPVEVARVLRHEDYEATNFGRS